MNKKDSKFKKAKFSWYEFEDHKIVNREAYAILKGKWAYTLEGKKKIKGNYFSIVEEYSKVPEGSEAEFQEIIKKYNL